MLDVLHVFFEESFSHATDEHAQRISATREAVYQTLYGREYPYPYKRESSKKEFDPESLDTIDDFNLTEPEEIKVFNPKKPKKYVAPTNFNGESDKPFGGILDAPIG